MPQGKGTYGSQVGRPSKKDKQKRKPYLTAGVATSSKRSNVERGAGSLLNPYSRVISHGLDVAGGMEVGDKVVDPRFLSVLEKANNTVANVVQGVVDTVIPGGKTPLRDWIKKRREAKAKKESLTFK